ncbi:hypothetical protein, partial [Streptococcus pneumoniae]|uniref:hypothetical protein n=1 Tax=Streptococcus pneumoniae TaxID=1313 RepID=UPI0018B05E68
CNVKDHGAKPHQQSNGQFIEVGTGSSGEWNEAARAVVWEVWDKATGLRLMICDGYDDCLTEPGEPFPKFERFFPYLAQT